MEEESKRNMSKSNEVIIAGLFSILEFVSTFMLCFFVLEVKLAFRF